VDLDWHPFKILLVEHYEVALLIFEALDDVFPGHFLAVLLSDTLVTNGALIAFAEKVKFYLLARAGGGIETHRNIHQTKTNRTLPDRSHE
jgi:hypothetical protein